MTTAFLLLTLGLAVFFDLRERRIPNLLIAAGLAGAMLLAALNGGSAALGSAMGAMAVAMMAFIPFFALGLIGAGDVKLAGVVGSLVGFDALFPVLLYILIAGGIFGLFAVAASGNLRQLFWNFRLWLITLTSRGQGEVMTVEEIAAQSAARIPYAVAIAAGALVWLAVR